MGLRIWRRRRVIAPVPVLEDFGITVTLRRGDKVVQRDVYGNVQVVRIAADETRLDAPGLAGMTASRDQGKP
jgi:hypothetical protein